jgi:radical SAM superfamily enzyme YgiQ (UPF0313 family)
MTASTEAGDDSNFQSLHMRYKGMVIRPPSEAYSYLLQVTYGCSHNRCAFCGTYMDKRFSIRDIAEVMEDIEAASKAYPDTRRVFLCDGNALILPTDKLLDILGALDSAFPQLGRVGIYANARDILRKDPEDLNILREKRLGIIYLGLESGSDEVLKDVNKGETAARMTEAVRMAENCGIKTSVIILLGLGGKKKSKLHAVESGRVASRMNPRFLSCLTLMLVPGTPLFEQHERGEFELLTPREMLQELELIVENLELEGTVFRANHASNYLPLKGRFPADKERLLAEIRSGLEGKQGLRPEFLRGL